MNRKNPDLHAKALALKAKGVQQKDIAQQLGVSEKSVSSWITNAPATKAQKALCKLQDRISKEADTLTPDDVAKLTDSISKLYKIAYPDTKAY